MSQSKSTLLLEHHLKHLKLPTIAREYVSLAEVCARDRSDYPEYLLRLAERELLDRERKSAERRLKDARFPVSKTIDSFDFTSQPSVNEQLYRELLRGEYIDTHCCPDISRTMTTVYRGLGICLAEAAQKTSIKWAFSRKDEA